MNKLLIIVCMALTCPNTPLHDPGHPHLNTRPGIIRPLTDTTGDPGNTGGDGGHTPPHRIA